MNRERWQEIDRVFASILERPANEREAFLREASRFALTLD